jgi:N-acetylmuramoyl-L-alanine amidase
MDWPSRFGIWYSPPMTRRGIVTLAVLGAAAVAVVLSLTLPRLLRSEEPEPAPVYVIALDAGHGGRDPGATVGDVLEKDLNLEIVERLQARVDAETDLVAVPTRTLDIFVPLEDRIRIAEEAGAVIYVSVHVNSFDTPDAYGAETIVSDAHPVDGDSWHLGELIQDSLVNATGARDRGTRSQESYLQRTEMPAVSVEVGYMTNPDEMAKLVDPVYQQTIAEGILAGIRQFIDWKYAAAPPAQP